MEDTSTGKHRPGTEAVDAAGDIVTFSCSATPKEFFAFLRARLGQDWHQNVLTIRDGAEGLGAMPTTRDGGQHCWAQSARPTFTRTSTCKVGSEEQAEAGGDSANSTPVVALLVFSPRQDGLDIRSKRMAPEFRFHYDRLVAAIMDLGSRQMPN